MGVERIVTLGYLPLTQEQKNYCTTRKKFVALEMFIRQFRDHLLCRIFRARTDHSSLT